MGREVICVVRHQGEAVEAKALLESEEIIVRGALKLRIPFRAISGVAATDGELSVLWSNGPTAFDLGASESARWAEKIRNPRTLLDKLGVSASSRLALQGIADPDFRRALAAQRGGAVSTVGAADADIILYQADAPEALDEIPRIRAAMGDTAALWVVTPKRTTGLMDVDVMAAGKAAGLVDNKVVKFSESHTALRFVVPVASRATSKKRA